MMILLIELGALVHDTSKGVRVELGGADNKWKLDHRVDTQVSLLLDLFSLNSLTHAALSFFLFAVLRLMVLLGDFMDGKLQSKRKFILLAHHIRQNALIERFLGILDIDAINFSFFLSIFNILNDLHVKK